MSEPVYPIRSPIRYDRAGDDEKACRVSTPDGSSSSQELIEYDGPRVDWCAELGIPYLEERGKLEAMAATRGFSARGFECVLLDESPTRFAGGWRHRVQEIAFREGGHYFLTLSHTGLVIGSVGSIRLAPPGEVAGVEGACLTARGRLYDSELASRAWTGMLLGIFPAICAVTARQPESPVGTGELIEAALGDVAGCLNARITRLLKETPFGVLDMTTSRVPIAELPADVQRALIDQAR